MIDGDDGSDPINLKRVGDAYGGRRDAEAGSLWPQVTEVNRKAPTAQATAAFEARPPA